jgi:hypothetical protein
MTETTSEGKKDTETKAKTRNVKHMIFMYELNANKIVTYFYVAPIAVSLDAKCEKCILCLTCLSSLSLS